MTIDEILKLVQITFYVVAGTLGILTYLSAKKGLLNTVNTEYHKRAFDKIENLSQELLSEFDPKSENYWANGDTLKDFLKETHEVFEKNKEQILKKKEFHSGIRMPKVFDRLQAIVQGIKSDPFLPKEIRNEVIKHLENRAEKIFGIHIDEINKHLQDLANGKYEGNYEHVSALVHNRINDKLYENNCGISQVEEQVHDIRLFIQKYLENFNPLK